MTTTNTNKTFIDTNATVFAERFYRYTDGTNDSEVFAFLTLTVLPGGAFIADPLLNRVRNGTDVLLSNVPNGTMVKKYNEAAQAYEPSNVCSGGSWSSNPHTTLLPSEGAHIYWCETQINITFCGIVPQGNLTCYIETNLSIMSTMVPLTTGLDALDFPAVDGDIVYMFNNATQAFDPIYTYFGGYGWYNPDSDVNPDPPAPPPGVSFFVYGNTTTNRLLDATI